MMKRCLLAICLATASIAAASIVLPASAQQTARAALDGLKAGGFVIVLRHGRTNESQAFPRDVSPTDLSDCSGQLMLTDAAREQARAIGAAFTHAGIQVGKVLASGFCRAMEMGRLAFGRAEASDALLIEAYAPVAGAPVPPAWPQRVEEMKRLIATRPEPGTNTVLITHFPNIKAMLGTQLGFGEAAILEPDGHGGAALVARIPAREWPGL